jgi:hypothetical protein
VTVAPSSVRLQVRNGTSRSGLARTAADDLRARGFVVTGTSNASSSTGQTVVLYGAQRADAARTVAAAVPGATLRQDDSVGAAGVVLVVGDDYKGVQAVTVAPKGGAAPASASPAAAPPSAAPGGATGGSDAKPCVT